MSTFWVSTEQKYQGIGEIRMGDRFLAKVKYDLDEDQQYMQIEELGAQPPAQPTGTKRLKGTIDVIEGEDNLTKYSSRSVTLCLATNSSEPIVIISRLSSSLYEVSQ
ncbi:MAG: hypothetical protein ACOYYS_15900 [Chloroflexota bacterium]